MSREARTALPTLHRLKCWPQHFDDVVSGRKTFELRYNDRGFKVGDLLLLKRYRPAEPKGPQAGYTGEEYLVTVTHVLEDPEQYWLRHGVVALSIAPAAHVGSQAVD